MTPLPTLLPSYNQIGYGWAQGADGRIYVCQVFVGR